MQLCRASVWSAGRAAALEQAMEHLKNEEQIQKAVNDPEITVVIGDPLYGRAFRDEPEKKRFLPGVDIYCSFLSKVGPGSFVRMVEK